MKKLLVIAVAAALAAPAAMADTTLYGKLHASVGQVKNSSTTAGGVTTTRVNDTLVESHASRIGVKGATALDNGMEATYGLEFGLDVDGDNSNSLDATGTPRNQASATSAAALTQRNTFVGLKGKFGEVRVGKHDTPAKLATAGMDIFADTYADMSNVIAADNERVDNAVAYINKFGPVTVAAAHSTGVNVNVDGLAVATGNAAPGTTCTETSVAGGLTCSDANTFMAVYGNGPWTAALGHTGIAGVRKNTNLGLGWKAEAGHQANLVYETVKYGNSAIAVIGGVAGDSAKETNVVLNGVYKMGNIGLKAQYGESKLKYTPVGAAAVTGKEKTTALGLDYSLGKKTTAYVLLSEDKNALREDMAPGASGKIKTTSVGLVTEF